MSRQSGGMCATCGTISPAACSTCGGALDSVTSDDAAVPRRALSRDVPDLDSALYAASCFAPSAGNRTVHIYCTTLRAYANPETEERYLILDDNDGTRHHLNPEEQWELVYSLTASPRR